jgi:organic radical activating enzyme
MTINNDRWFPIQTATSCRSKWGWSTIWLNFGKTGSCCVASISDIGDDFDNFHNTEKKLKSRELMLQGQWPGDGCESCQSIEQSGGFSDRQFQNSIPNIYPRELDHDATAIRVEPAVLEVYFSNACNLRCVYCTANLSSAIQAENTKFNGAILPNTEFEFKHNQYRDQQSRFWTWFEAHGQNLQRLQVAGGEPFLQKDVHTLIKKFETASYPDLEFNIITNLSLKSDVVFPQLNDLATHVNNKKIKQVDIQASIDCWGDQQVYVRDGVDLDQFDINMKNMLNLDKFRVGLLSTVNSLSIIAMPELLKKWKSWNQINTVHWYMHLVRPSDSVFSPLIFRYQLFESALHDMITGLPEETWDHQATKNTLLGIKSQLQQQCVNNIDRQHDLYQFLKENDKRRNLNWQKTFPWLLEELERNNVV